MYRIYCVECKYIRLQLHVFYLKFHDIHFYVYFIPLAFFSFRSRQVNPRTSLYFYILITCIGMLAK